MHLSLGRQTSRDLSGECSANITFFLFTFSKCIVNGALANRDKSTQLQVNNSSGRPKTLRDILKVVESAELLNW